ncbi:DUF1700 domain-containing protein [Saccharothrix stipae]
MNTQTSTEVRHYLDGMRAALADLPAAEVAEIMDDASAHVTEVADEMGEEFSLAALTDRLGTPRAYADELRAAAGYPSPAPAAAERPEVRSTLLARFALWSLVAGTVMAFSFALTRGDGVELTVIVGLCAAAGALLVFRQSGLLAEIARLPETVALKDALDRADRSELTRALVSLRVFQPVWWIGRALLIAAAGALLHRSPVLLLSLALAALSLPAGPKSKTDRRWLWISLPATAFAVGVLLFILGTLVSRFDSYPFGNPAPVTYNQQPAVRGNIYVFDKDGKPLTDVHLYDENGRPLNAPWYGCQGEDRHDNRFPRPRVVHDENGCHEVPGVPFTIVMPTMPTTTVPTTSGPTTSGPTTSGPTTTPSPSSSASAAPTTVTTG